MVDHVSQLEYAQSLEDTGKPQSIRKAFNIYKTIPADIMRGESHYRAGRLCIESNGAFVTNYKHALDWFETAALYRNGDARYEIGQIYENGWGVEVDYAKAKRTYHQALDVGCVKACKRIGLLFLQAPTGVIYDLGRAEYYLLRYEAECGADAETHVALGDRYRLINNGYYHRKAIDRYAQAVSLKEGLGCYWIGHIYEKFYRDIPKAVQHYKEGSKLIDGGSKWRLAQLYISGQGVKMDYQAARILLIDAIKLGISEAKEDRIQLDATIAKAEEKTSKEAKKANNESSESIPIPNAKKETTLSEEPEPAKAKSNAEPVIVQERSFSEQQEPTNVKSDALIAQEKPNIEATIAPKKEEPLVKIIGRPTVYSVTNEQVRLLVWKLCSYRKLKFSDVSSKKSRGYKFKTIADVKKQFKKAERCSPSTLLQELHFTSVALQYNQTQVTAALDNVNTCLFKNVIKLTQKMNRITLETEQSTRMINENNREIETKFEELGSAVDIKYDAVCQRLQVLEEESAKKDKTIELLMAKLESQNQQLEKLMNMASCK